jgi:tetratricopeptide (TPR) repeat protein
VSFVFQNILLSTNRRHLLLCFCLTAAAQVRAEPQVAQFVAGLRERGLYELAGEYGGEQWQRADLSDRQRADLAIQLALVYTDWALVSPPEARDVLWAKAGAYCAQVKQDWPNSPRRPLVDVQAALVSLARGELAREENTAGNTGTVDAPELEHLRTAARGLAAVSEEIGERLVELRLRPPSNASPDALTASELESLELNIAFHLARAQHQLGLCYPPRSADRDNSLLQATSRLTPLAQTTPADKLAWKARVELIACLRELGRFQVAQENLQTWSRQSVPAEVAPLLSAEEVRLLVAAGQALRAQDIARQALHKHKGANGELALALVEAEMAAWRQSANSGAGQDGRALTEMVGQIERQHGPYWGRRAQRIVGGTLASADAADVARLDAAAVLIAARQLYATGRIDDAIANYDVAARQLGQDGKSDEAFAASMTAAAIEREARQFAEAADRYRRLALAMPTHARAAEAHQLAILCIAQQAAGGAASDRPAVAADYEQLLDEHLAKWPSADSSDAVRVWFGKLLAARSDWPAAIQMLQQVREGAADYAESIQLLCECYEQQLKRLAATETAEAGAQRARLLAEATKQLQPVITGADNRWPVQWSNLQRETAIELARLHLGDSSGSSPYAERLLATLLGSQPLDADGAAEEWQAVARPLFIVALARNGKASEAQAMAADLDMLPTASLHEVVDRLHDLLASDGAERAGRREVGQLALAIIARLDSRRDEADASTLARIEMCRAAALAAAGNRPEALALYKRLVIQSPDDGNVHERYATLLADSNDAAELREALASWHMVERRSRRGSPRWRRARHARIELLNRLGDRTEADKLRQLTRLLYPDWDTRAER